MIKSILHLALILTSVVANAQFNWDSKNWDKTSLGFGCSVDASMTKPVTNIVDPFLNKDFDIIRRNLNSDLPADQFLAVFLLENLEKKKELELSADELERIEQIKFSTDLVPVCAGCTYWDEQPLNELFQTKNKHVIYRSAENWFKTYYKIYYKRK